MAEPTDPPKRPDDPRPAARSSASRPRGYRPIKGQGSIHAGIYWSHQVMSMSIGLVVPMLIGWFADSQLGTEPALTVVGVFVGFALLMYRLWQMISPDAPPVGPAAGNAKPASATDAPPAADPASSTESAE